jgi:hypothetical protein
MHAETSEAEVSWSCGFGDFVESAVCAAGVVFFAGFEVESSSSSPFVSFVLLFFFAVASAELFPSPAGAGELHATWAAARTMADNERRIAVFM